MKIKRSLSKNTYNIYKLMQEGGMLEDCHTAEEVATAILPLLSQRVTLERYENYEEQLIYFVGKILDGTVAEYALVNRVIGTEPYVTHRLEQDIKDVKEYMIIPCNEIDMCDTVIKKSIIYDELKELLDDYREEEYYIDMMVASYYGL